MNGPLAYRRMPIEVESPEELGYGTIECNLSESSVADMRLRDLGVDLGDLTAAYTAHRGRDDLREAIAEDCGLGVDDVLVTAGASFALFIIHTSLLGAGSRLAVVAPNYATNLEAPRLLGAAIDVVQLDFDSQP
ncbi:MAG: hypothetical protein QOE92_1756, partial [Chloroflexota bacterium]|nr:hypothetical protein [Chloroflexota bacterium]